MMSNKFSRRCWDDLDLIEQLDQVAKMLARLCCNEFAEMNIKHQVYETDVLRLSRMMCQLTLSTVPGSGSISTIQHQKLHLVVVMCRTLANVFPIWLRSVSPLRSRPVRTQC